MEVEVIKLCVGDQYSVLLTPNGTLYSAGLNNVGQCATGTFATPITSYTKIRSALFGNITGIACGYRHVVAWDLNNYYIWGGLGFRLGLGTGGSNLNTPTKIQSKIGLPARACAGSTQTVFLTRNYNSIYTTGSDSSTGILPRPSIPTFLMSGSDAICGEGWSMFLQNGQVFAAGANTYGQFGMGSIGNSLDPVSSLNLTFSVNHLYGALGTSFLVNHDGTIWTAGKNTYSLTGSEFNNANILNWTQCFTLESLKITHMSVGFVSATFSTDQGDIYGAGGGYGTGLPGLTLAHNVTVLFSSSGVMSQSNSIDTFGAMMTNYTWTCNGTIMSSPNVCNGVGVCTSQDVCECLPGWTGANCSLTTCYGNMSNYELVCSGLGSCIGPDECKCVNGSWSGHICDVYVPPFVCNGVGSHLQEVCSGNGVCVGNNRCLCNRGTNGNNCEFMTFHWKTNAPTQSWTDPNNWNVDSHLPGVLQSATRAPIRGDVFLLDEIGDYTINYDASTWIMNTSEIGVPSGANYKLFISLTGSINIGNVTLGSGSALIFNNPGVSLTVPTFTRLYGSLSFLGSSTLITQGATTFASVSFATTPIMTLVGTTVFDTLTVGPGTLWTTTYALQISTLVTNVPVRIQNRLIVTNWICNRDLTLVAAVGTTITSLTNIGSLSFLSFTATIPLILDEIINYGSITHNGFAWGTRPLNRLTNYGVVTITTASLVINTLINAENSILTITPTTQATFGSVTNSGKVLLLGGAPFYGLITNTATGRLELTPTRSTLPVSQLNITNSGVFVVNVVNFAYTIASFGITNNGSFLITATPTSTVTIGNFTQGPGSSFSVQGVFTFVTPNVFEISEGDLILGGPTLPARETVFSSTSGMFKVTAVTIFSGSLTFKKGTALFYDLTSSTNPIIRVYGCLKLETLLLLRLAQGLSTDIGTPYTFILYRYLCSIDYRVLLIGAPFRKARVEITRLNLPSSDILLEKTEETLSLIQQHELKQSFESMNQNQLILDLSIGTLEFYDIYKCHYLGNRRTLEIVRFAEENKVMFTITTPEVNNWVGFGFGATPHLNSSYMMVSTTYMDPITNITNLQPFEVSNHTQLLQQPRLFLDMGSYVSQSLFQIGRNYLTLSALMSLRSLETPKHLWYVEGSSYNVTAGHVWQERHEIDFFNGPFTPCTNFLQPHRLESRSQTMIAFTILFYLLLLVLCIAFYKFQPLHSRGLAPILTLVFLIFQMGVETRNYDILPLEQRSLCLWNGYVLYPLHQISFVAVFFYFVRYFSIIAVNSTKNQVVLNEKTDTLTYARKVHILKWMGNFWVMSGLTIIYILFSICVHSIVIAICAPNFLCDFTTLTVLRVVNTLFMIIIFVALAVVLVGDFITNYRSIIKCHLMEFFFKKDPFLYRVQMYFFMPFLFLVLIFEFAFLFSLTNMYQIVRLRDLTDTFNFFSFGFLLIVDAIFPLIITIVRIIYIVIFKPYKRENVLENLLLDPRGYDLFLIFCKYEYAVENLYAWTDIEEWKRVFKKFGKQPVEGSDKNPALVLAEMIHSRYFNGKQSLFECNVQSSHCRVILEKITSWDVTEELFEGVLRDIKINLTDTYFRFTGTQDFRLYQATKTLENKLLTTIEDDKFINQRIEDLRKKARLSIHIQSQNEDGQQSLDAYRHSRRLSKWIDPNQIQSDEKHGQSPETPSNDENQDKVMKRRSKWLEPLAQLAETFSGAIGNTTKKDVELKEVSAPKEIPTQTDISVDQHHLPPLPVSQDVRVVRKLDRLRKATTVNKNGPNLDKHLDELGKEDLEEDQGSDQQVANVQDVSEEKPSHENSQ